LSTELGTSRTGERPLRADARRNRERVLEAARIAFAECGTDLAMEELARRAGVGVGTVYRHFPNKDALLDALLAEWLTQILERTQAALDRDDPWEAFRDMVRAGAEMQADDYALCDIVMSRKELSDSPVVAELRTQMEAQVAETIRRAQASGEMRADFTIDDVPMLFASVAASIRLMNGDPAWRRQLEFTLDGLRASSASRS
jgi:AcrR family transcriptional regulator